MSASTSTIRISALKFKLFPIPFIIFVTRFLALLTVTAALTLTRGVLSYRVLLASLTKTSAEVIVRA